MRLLEYQGYNPMQHVNNDSNSEEEELSEVEEVDEGQEEEEENEQNEQDAKWRRLQYEVDRVSQVISRRQEQEEENNPIFERRHKNMEEIRYNIVMILV